jgi:hypothetical protein
MASAVSLGIVYCPEGSNLPVILSSISDGAMLISAIRSALQVAEMRAGELHRKDVFLSRGYRHQASVLRRLLGEVMATESKSIPVLQ